MPKLVPATPPVSVSTGVAFSKPAYAVKGPSLTTCRSRAIPEASKRALLPPSELAWDVAVLIAANATHVHLSSRSNQQIIGVRVDTTRCANMSAL